MEIDITPFILIFAIASIVAILAKYMRLPYTITLILAGIVLVVFGLDAPFELGYDLIFHVLLPPLLFEGALHMQLSHLRKNARVILLLVIPGLLGSVFLVGGLLSLLFSSLPFIFALLLAAILIPTDPATILALYKDMKVPHRLRSIVEGESVFDDGLAIVLWNVLVTIILASGGAGGRVAVEGHHILAGIGEFLKLSFLGIVLGYVMGYLAYMLIRRIDDKFTEVMITVILSFGIFALAEMMGGSGVFAVVISGLVLGNYGTRFAMAPSTRLSLISFWSFLAFAVNSFLFILIGMSVSWEGIANNLLLIIVTLVLLWLARGTMIFLIGRFMNRRQTELPKRWQITMWWGGFRGAIPIAMALSIPLYLDQANAIPFPHRDTILSVTFGVVLFSLLIQGLTIKHLLKRLGFTASSKGEAEREMRETAVLLRDAMGELSSLKEEGLIPDKAFDWLYSRYSLANSQLLTELGMMVNEHGFIPKDEYMLAVKETLESKRNAVKEAWERGLISGSIGERLVMELNDQISALDVSDVTPPTHAVDILRNVSIRRPGTSGGGIQRTCGLCLQPILPGQETYTCRCGTTYHRDCLDGVDRCPVCIATIETGAGGSQKEYISE